ncbi:MAG: hypothetical protein P4M05_34540 [Bradyrhizobium sp.]|nr:hypothetical protein [Bradyrhizobium sp.]
MPIRSMAMGPEFELDAGSAPLVWRANRRSWPPRTFCAPPLQILRAA